jgi:hypothetical protein
MESAFEIFEWEGCPVDMLREHVLGVVSGGHKTCESNDVPQVFKDYAKSIIEGELGYEVDHWVYWCSDITALENLKPSHVPPEHDLDWQLKFPHTHGWDGRTMILYLQEPEEGGALVVLDDDVETEIGRFEPKVGWAAVMKDHAIHGIKAIHGDTNRVTIIAGAYPYPVGSTVCRCANQDWVRVSH